MEKGEPLLKCHARGREVQEPGPGMREMDQHQETSQTRGPIIGMPEGRGSRKAEAARRWLICRQDALQSCPVSTWELQRKAQGLHV